MIWFLVKLEVEHLLRSLCSFTLCSRQDQLIKNSSPLCFFKKMSKNKKIKAKMKFILHFCTSLLVQYPLIKTNIARTPKSDFLILSTAQIFEKKFYRTCNITPISEFYSHEKFV
jgi:hypothetical protein